MNNLIDEDPTGHESAQRWRNFGKDRLYVNDADGCAIGWLDLKTGERVIKLPTQGEVFERVVGEWLAAHPETSSVLIPVPDLTGQSLEARSVGHTPQGPSAGWYEDPGKLASYRWWDGSQWTAHTSGETETDQAPPPGSAAAQAATPTAQSQSQPPASHPLLPSAPRPDRRLIRTAADAEVVAAEWMRWMGFHDARRTPTGPDGGIDVTAAGAVAQVKMHAQPVGRPDLQRFHGASRGRRTLFFSLESYTNEARAWADEVGMALFRFDLQGEPFPVNSLAKTMMAARDGGITARSCPTASLATFPTCCQDADAVAVAQRQCKGLLGTREQVRWMAEAWIELLRIRVDYTTEEGFRRQLRHHWGEQLFEAVAGAPFPIQLPKNVPGVVSGRPGMSILSARVSGGDVIRESHYKVWKHSRGLRDPKARARCAQDVKLRGIPPTAGSIELSSSSSILYPVFIAELDNRSGHRLLAVDGMTGRIMPRPSSALTTHLVPIKTEIRDLKCRVLST